MFSPDHEPRFHWGLHLGRFLVLLLLALIGTEYALARTAPLTSVEAIRAVPGWTELEAHPLALEAVVTHVDKRRNLIVLQDQFGAVALDLGAAEVEAVPGQRVQLSAEDSWPVLPDVPRYPHRADSSELLTQFESAPSVPTEYYIDRFRGHLYPPVSGIYHFYIASDDSSQLLLGTDDSLASRRRIAEVRSYTRPRDWNRTSPQRSEGIWLEAGRRYFIEAVHEQAEGPTHLSVAWEGPSIPLTVIEGQFLSPWDTDSSSSKNGSTALPPEALRGSLLRELWRDQSIEDLDVLAAARHLQSVLSVSGVSLKVLGAGTLPEPVLLKAGQPLEAKDNFRWCEVEGTVDFVACDGNRLSLELSDEGQQVQAIVSDWHQDLPSNLRNRRVRVLGVAESVLREGEKPVLGRVWVRPSSDIVVTHEAPRKDLSRLTTIAELSYGDPRVFRDTAVKCVGRVVKQEGDVLSISDSGTVSAYTSIDGLEWRAIGKPLEIAMGTTVYVGLAVNSRVSTASSRAIFSQVSGVSPALKHEDVGAPSRAGRLHAKDGTYVVDGVGSDIWDAPDQFTFVYDRLEGEVSIVAHLDSFTPADPTARAGIMIRESMSLSSQFVDLLQTNESGKPAVSLQWRWAQAGSSTRALNDSESPAPLPAWFKLERRFNTVSVYTSGGVRFEQGDQVEVLGYVSTKDGRLSLVDASVNKHAAEKVVLTPQASWRPLVQIAQVNASDGKWGGLDFFRFRGVVTFCGDVLGRRYWAMQDQSAATLLSGRYPSNRFLVQPGSLVEVFSHPGWAPPTANLYADNVFVQGQARFPKPVLHPAEYLLPKRGEGTWIELEGIVRAVSDSGLMELKVRSELFSVAVSGAQVARLRELVDAGLRLRGVIVYPNERERLLLVPSAEHLEILDAPLRDPFSRVLESTREFTADSLLNQARHRARVRGRVTYADPVLLYIQDDFGGARVELEAPAHVELGSLAEFVGFPEWGEDDSMVLRHSVMRPNEGGAPVQPVAVSPSDLASGRYTARLIRLRAVVSRSLGAAKGELLELEAEQQAFRVALSGAGASVGEIPAGSLIELTGIAVKEAGLLQASHSSSASVSLLPLKLLLRSPADLVVLQKPSWWVVRRALLVVSFVGFIAVVGSVWIHRLRQRVKQRTAELAATMEKLETEARMSATLAERDRLAGEIHDSLEQGLNGIMLQLEGTAAQDSCPPEIRSALKLACNMASFSRTEVQYAVWELQSPMLEDSELAVAIEKIMRQITPDSLQTSVRVEGASRRLASVVEHHLLRIAQEAINNTVKHAAARSVEVLISYGAESVTLTVSDDGCGFDPAGVRTGGLGHFGLRSLRSRAGKIHATLEVTSSPGKGTKLRVCVPANPV